MLASVATSAFKGIIHPRLLASLHRAGQLLSQGQQPDAQSSHSKDQLCCTTAGDPQERESDAIAISRSPLPVIQQSYQWSFPVPCFSGTSTQLLSAAYSSAVDSSFRSKQNSQQHLNQTDAKWLTSQIKNCSSLKQLQRLVTAHGRYMNHIHVSAAVACLSALCGQQKLQHSQQQHQQASQTMQQLWDILQQQLHNCTSRELASIIYTLLSKVPASIKQQYQLAVIQQLFPAFMQQLHSAAPQAVSTVLYGLAVSEQQVSAQQVQQLVNQLVDKAQSATPQAISNTLWAVATMQHKIPPLHVQNLVSGLAAKAEQAKPQELSIALWAVAEMNDHLQEQQLQQLLDAISGQLDRVDSQALSTAIWACGRLRYLPQQLLLDPRVQETLQTAALRSLVNIAWGLGSLGFRDEQLMGQILQQVQLRLQNRHHQQPGDQQQQSLAVVAWAVAVLDLRVYAVDVVKLVSTVQWDSIQEQHMQQLYQVHWWLLDTGYSSSHGLLGVLTAEQLQQCQEAYDGRSLTSSTVLAGGPTSLHKQVFAAVKRLPVDWLQPLEMERSTADGLLMIDISGMASAGQLVAVEVDGPIHFVAPEYSLNGPTQYRNRALIARGYTVVSVPYFEWVGLKGGSQQKQYLLQLLKAAGVA